MSTEDSKLLEQLKQFADEKQMAPGKVYTPPNGNPILNLPQAAKLYDVEPPTRQKDLLIGYERRHTIPIAMVVAAQFGVNPVPDDVYRAAPVHARNNLFTIISRSGIVKHDVWLNWDAVVVVVQRLCIVRVNCDLNPNDGTFFIRQLLLWSRQEQTYQPVKDPQGGPIDPSVLPYILERYAAIEGLQ
jgi:hypothetical protein